ncbi:MAG: lipid II:glycine glycyltransferase FemX [Candidatus Omnitrophota bacterium]
MIHIKTIQTPTDEQWDRIWSACDQATFYHSRVWHLIWQEYTGRKIKVEPLLLNLSDGNQVLIPVSCHTVANGLIKRYLSSPASSFGGWISDKALTEEHHGVLFEFMRNQYPFLVLRLNPYYSFTPKIKDAFVIQDNTQVLKLDTDFDQVYARFSKRHKTYINKAQKQGVVIQPANSDSDWSAFYDMYLETFKRWGDKASSKYKQSFFESIHQLNSPHARLWMAYFEDRPVAGVIIFYSKKIVLYGYPASFSQHQSLRATDVLLYDIIKDACARQYQFFDFSPSGWHKGVIEYKERFGSEFVSCNIINTQPGWLKLMEKTYKTWLVKFT